jgi:hypothetical protein
MRFKNDSYSIEVGTFVMNNHHGLLRMGVVKDMRIDESGWAMYKVDFLEDDIYVSNKTFHSELSGKNQFQTEHRRDQLVKVNPQWLQNVLDAREEYQNER